MPAGPLQEIPLEAIAPNPYQPRHALNQESLAELAASVRLHGVMQPVLVRPHQDGYQLVAGFRRLEAARLAGLEQVPAVVRVCDDREMLELALVENLQREDINPIEEAEALQRLCDEFSLTQDQVAQRLGRSRSSVANSVRLLSLLPEVRESIASGQISPGHGRALLALEDPEDQRGLWEYIVAEGLSVRQAELEVASTVAARVLPREAIRELTRDPQAEARREYGTDDVNLKALVDDLRDVLQTRVRLRPNQQEGGQVVIDYYTGEDLTRIRDCIAGE